MQYGNLLVVHQTAAESKVWGYSPFDYLAKTADKKNWHVTYNDNGSLRFKSLATSNSHFLSAYSISLEECVEVAAFPVVANLLWALYLACR